MTQNGDISDRERLKAEIIADLRRDGYGANPTILPRPGIDGAPVQPGHKLIEVRQFASAAERELMFKRMPNYWPHISVDSTLVAVIGNHYKPGCWEAISNMVIHTNKRGVRCGLSEIQDRCFAPYDALGTMRNESILKAQLEGWEWLCMVDADIKPEPDALLRLLGWQVPIVAPYVVELGTGRKLHGPYCEPDTGMHQIKWCVLSMLVFRTAVFNCLPAGTMWGDAIGADEGYHFQRLAYYGHRPYLDTGVHLIADEKPHYPLASLRFNKADYERYWDATNEKRQKPPDRRASDPNSPFIVDGEYNPFAPQPDKPAVIASATGTEQPTPVVAEPAVTVAAPAPQ